METKCSGASSLELIPSVRKPQSEKKTQQQEKPNKNGPK